MDRQIATARLILNIFIKMYLSTTYLSMRTSILNPQSSFACAAKIAVAACEHALGLISNLVKKSGRRKCDRHEERHAPLRRRNERLADVLIITGAQSDRYIFKGILRRDFQL